MPRHAPRATALLFSLAALTLLSACQTRVFSVQDGDMFRRSAASAPQDWSTQLQNLSLPRQVSTVQFKGQDGTALGGVFFKHAQAKATVLYFQGGGNHVQKDFRWLATLAADLPVNVLVWDYRGMGLSEGTGGTAHMPGLAAELEAFRETIRSGGRPAVDAEDGLWAVAIASALLRAGETGRSADLTEIAGRLPG